MWRSLFLAIGIMMCLLGAECLVVEEAVFARSLTAPPPSSTAESLVSPSGTEFKTQEWMPYSFMATGAVIILYTITIPKRLNPS